MASSVVVDDLNLNRVGLDYRENLQSAPRRRGQIRTGATTEADISSVARIQAT